VRLVNEKVNITVSDLAKKMPESTFDKFIPIMEFEEYGVANGHSYDVPSRLETKYPG
jgi:hypothetical protein